MYFTPVPPVLASQRQRFSLALRVFLRWATSLRPVFSDNWVPLAQLNHLAVHVTLRKKTLLIIGAAIAFLLAALFISSRILLGGFTDLEQADTIQNVQRVTGAIENDNSELEGITRDWATWDDTYAFIDDRNSGYFNGNLAEDTSWINNKLNLMMYINASGQVVYAGAFDLVNEKRVEVPAAIQAQVAPGSPLLEHPDLESGKGGIVMLSDGPMMIASYPILPSDKQGPSKGSLIWGRYLDKTRIDYLAQITRLSISTTPLDTTLPPDFQNAFLSISTDVPTLVKPLGDNDVAGYTILNDIYSRQALMIRVDAPRQIFSHGQTTMKYLLILLLSSCLVFGLFSVVSLEKWVLSPTARLSREVSRIGVTSDHSARILTTGGKDELSRLSEVINETLEALEISQKEVQLARDHLEKRVDERTAQLSDKIAALETLAEIDQEVIAMNEPQAILDLACHRAADLMHASMSLIRLKDANGGQIAASYGFSRADLDAAAIEKQTSQDTGSCAEVPLIAEGQELGSLIVCDDSRKQWQADDVQVLNLLANQVALAIDGARLFVEEKTRRDELGSLYELSRALVEAPPDTIAILDLVTRHTVKTIHVTFARIAMIEGSELVWRSAYPVRVLDYDLDLGHKIFAAAVPFFQGLMGEHNPKVVRDSDKALGAQERECLLLDVAHTVCMVPLRAGDKAMGVLVMGEARREEREPFTPEKLRLAHSIGDQTTSALKRAELFAQLEDGYLNTVLALAKAVEAKDNYTSGHAEGIANMAVAVGKMMKMTGDDLEDLRFGAILHDVGKIGMPDEILNKPGRLTEEEWILMKKHPVTGAQILAPVPRLAVASTIVLHHHEKFGGGGYPDGIVGSDIPLGSRILSVVDSYGAMIDKRSYKEAMTREEAFAELIRCSGSQFDPEIVEVFIGLIKRGLSSAQL